MVVGTKIEWWSQCAMCTCAGINKSGF
jgi:hypothetical protein